MAKPWHPDNRPDTSEGPGEGVVEAGEVELESEEIGVEQGDKAAYPLPPRRRDQR